MVLFGKPCDGRAYRVVSGPPASVPPSAAASKLLPFIPSLGAPIGAGRFAAILLAVWAISILPLAFTSYPPLLDYPSHLARVYVLAHRGEVPLLRAAYNPPIFLLPNIGMDLVMLTLSEMMPVDIAGRVFVALLFLLTLGGSAFLYWSIQRRLSLWPLAGAVFLYNWILLDGFLNYLLGVAVTLWGLGAWIALYEASHLKRTLVGAAFALTIFFCHLSAFGLFALAVGGYTLARTLRESGRSIGALALSAASLVAVFAAPMALFLLSSTGAKAGAQITFMWISKPLALRTLLSADLPLNVFIGPLIVLIAVWVSRRSLRVDPDMRLPLLLVLFAFLVLPEGMMTGFYVASRLIIAAWLMLLASSEPAPGTTAGSPWLTLALAVFVVYRSLVLAVEWRSYDRLTHGLTSTLDALPRGSTVFSATTGLFTPGHFGPRSWMQPPIWHWADLAVLRRQAFVPEMHALPGQQPLTISDRFADIYAYQDNNPISVDSRPSTRIATEAFERRWGLQVNKLPALDSVAAHFRDLATAADLDASRVFLLVLDPGVLPEGAAALAGPIVARGERFLLIKPQPRSKASPARG